KYGRRYRCGEHSGWLPCGDARRSAEATPRVVGRPHSSSNCQRARAVPFRMNTPDCGRRVVRHDVYVAVVVFVLAWTGCRLYLPAFRAAGGRAMSYYEEFGPAVMAACGRGFVNPPTPAVPALDAFLLNRAERFECGQLDGMAAPVPLDDF